MLREVLEALDLQPGARVVDGTAGLGGHTRAMAEKVGETGEVFAFEKDPKTFSLLVKRVQDLPQVRPIHASYATMHEILSPSAAQGVLLDLGISSFLLEESGRGFSFRRTGEPLDMRFDPEEGQPLYLRLRTTTPIHLADILERFGEIRRARALARAIINARPRTVGELNDAVLSASPHGGVRLLRKVYQALRIWVNDEVNVLMRGLAAAWTVLAPGGRLAVLSYHSLEDRLAKCVRHFPGAREVIPGGRPPSPEEVARNPRARSARLRAYGKETEDAVALDDLLRVLARCARPGQ